MTLTEFLLARIAEDEALACHVGELLPDGSDDEAADNGYAISAEAHQLAARTLAECGAKRRIVEAFEEECKRRDIYNRDYDSGEYDFNDNDMRSRLSSNARCAGMEIALRALVVPFADHPDYDEAWRP